MSEETANEPQQPFIPLVANNQTLKDYGSAANYANAVRAWYMSSHNWYILKFSLLHLNITVYLNLRLQCQHQHFLQNNPVSTSAPTIQLPAFNRGGNPVSYLWIKQLIRQKQIFRLWISIIDEFLLTEMLSMTSDPSFFNNKPKLNSNFEVYGLDVFWDCRHSIIKAALLL